MSDRQNLASTVSSDQDQYSMPRTHDTRSCTAQQLLDSASCLQSFAALGGRAEAMPSHSAQQPPQTAPERDLSHASEAEPAEDGLQHAPQSQHTSQDQVNASMLMRIGKLATVALHSAMALDSP